MSSGTQSNAALNFADSFFDLFNSYSIIHVDQTEAANAVHMCNEMGVPADIIVSQIV